MKKLTKEDGIYHLKLSSRAYYALCENDILFIGELTAKSRSELKTMRNIGVSTVDEIDKELNIHGFGLDNKNKGSRRYRVWIKCLGKRREGTEE